MFQLKMPLLTSILGTMLVVLVLGFISMAHSPLFAQEEKTTILPGLGAQWELTEVEVEGDTTTTRESVTDAFNSTLNKNSVKLVSDPFLGNAFDFDGGHVETQYKYPDTGILSYTVSFWMRTARTYGSLDSGVIVENRGTSNEVGIMIGMGIDPNKGEWGNGDSIFMALSGNNIICGGYVDPNYSENKIVSDGIWHHVVGTWQAEDGDSFALEQFAVYIDGEKQVLNHSSMTRCGVTAPLGDDETRGTTVIGYDRAWDNAGWKNIYRGRLRNIQIYSRALEPEEVEALQLGTVDIEGPTGPIGTNLPYDFKATLKSDILDATSTYTYTWFGTDLDPIIRPNQPITDTVSVSLQWATSGTKHITVTAVESETLISVLGTYMFNITGSAPSSDESSINGPHALAYDDTGTFTVTVGPPETTIPIDYTWYVNGEKVETASGIQSQQHLFNYSWPAPEDPDQSPSTQAISVTVKNDLGYPITKTFTLTTTYAPEVTGLPKSLTTNENNAPSLDFTVVDTDTTSLADLGNNITFESSDEELVPLDNITWVGPDADGKGTVVITPDRKMWPGPWKADITMKVVDENGVESEQTIPLTVNAVNKAPSFEAVTASEPISLTEDVGEYSQPGWATDISPGDEKEATQNVSFILTTDNPDLFEEGPTITMSDTHATTGTLSFTLKQGANDTAHVTATLQDNGGTLNDGTDSFSQTFTVVAAMVNDPPEFTIDEPITIDEDADPQVATGWVTGITPGPNENQEVGFAVTTDRPDMFAEQPKIQFDATQSVSATLDATEPATATLMFAPAANAFGTATVSVTLRDNGGTANDGEDNTVKVFTITMTPANDPPTFAPIDQGSVPTPARSDAPLGEKIGMSGISPGLKETQTVSFTVDVLTNPGLFAQKPRVLIGEEGAQAVELLGSEGGVTGTLTFKPATCAFGVSTVRITMLDDETTSSTISQTLTFTVTAGTNSAPIASSDEITVTEDIEKTIVSTVLLANDSDPDTCDDIEIVTVGSSGVKGSNLAWTNGDTIYAAENMTYTPAEDFFGTDTFTYTINDLFPSAQSAQHMADGEVTVKVLSVNDAPTFTLSDTNSISTKSGAGLQNVADWAMDITAGAANEDDQELTFVVEVAGDDAMYFATLPSIDTNGTLTFVPTDTMDVDSVTINIDVTLQDNGGTENGGVDTSEMRSFSIVIEQGTRYVYLPLISRSEPLQTTPTDETYADLVGTLRVSPSKASYSVGEPVEVVVTITNTGEAQAGPFWVDLLINPKEVPTTPNARWNTFCDESASLCYGIAWGVEESLAPGASITLKSTADSYDAEQTRNWEGTFVSGTTDLYLFVDSWNDAGGTQGAVLESNEANNVAHLPVVVEGTSVQADALPYPHDIPPRRALGGQE